MTELGFTLFETAIGCCGLAWGEAGLVTVTLPESDPARTRARLTRRYPTAAPLEPPLDIRQVMAKIVSLLSGEPEAFSDVTLDMQGLGLFDRRVYDAARNIPVGVTRTYGDIARTIGDPGAARAVGESLGRNPWPIIVPCHRVLAAGRKSGGFSAPGGLATKARILSIEGARFGDEPTLFERLPVAFRPR